MPPSANKISVTASPGNLGLYINRVPGEEYLVVKGFQQESPLRKTRLQPGDRLQGINGVDLKDWSLDKLASYCKDNSDAFKKIDILQTPSAKLFQAFTPGRKKAVAHKKSSPLKSSRRKRVSPPLSLFQKLRPPPPVGYERYMVEVAPGTVGIRVKMVDDALTIYKIGETSSVKNKVNVDDIIEGLDALYDQTWDVKTFVEYAKKNVARTRFLHMFRKKKARWHLPTPTPQKQSSANFPNNARAPSLSMMYHLHPIGAASTPVRKPAAPVPFRESTSPILEALPEAVATPQKEAPNHALLSPPLYTSNPTNTNTYKYSAVKIRGRPVPEGDVSPVSTLKVDVEDSTPSVRTRKDMDWDEFTGAWVPAA